MGAERDPAPAPGRFKSLVQLRAWSARRFPRATLVTERLDLKAWNRIALILDTLAADWPGVASELGWITTRHPLWEDNPTGAIGAADSIFGEKIAFNPFYFAKPKRIVQAVDRGERMGLYPVGAKDSGEWYIVSHEWGHLLNAWLRRHDRERWLLLMGLFQIDLSAANQSAFEPTKAEAISQYATSRIADAFAEAFSVLQWQEESLRADIVERVSRILRGKS